MAWIESHQDIARHPKTIRLAKKLNISIPATIGHLHMLWWWALDFAPDGDLSKFENYEIAYVMMWENDPELLINALVFSGYLDEIQPENEENNVGIFIHDWFEHGGKLITKRAEEARRKKEFRDNQKPKRGRPKKIKSTSVGRPADGECNSNSNIKDINTTTSACEGESENLPEDILNDTPLQGEDSPFIQILDAYCELHRKLDIHVKDRERAMMRRVIDSGIPAKFAVAAMHKLYSAKKQREEEEGAIFRPPTSFTYYSSAIVEAWKAEQNTQTTPVSSGKFAQKQVGRAISDAEETRRYIAEQEELRRQVTEDRRRRQVAVGADP